MTYTIAVCTVKTPDDGQRNCPKHVEFYSKNKLEKLVYLVGFIIRICHDTRSSECQKLFSFTHNKRLFAQFSFFSDVPTNSTHPVPVLRHNCVPK